MPKNGIFNVLIVDDSAATVAYLRHILIHRPYFQVLSAYDAERALQIVAESEGKLDIVLLDLNLPGMNGLSAMKLIRQQYPTLPIIIITAELNPENRFLAYQAGANDFIMKPFNSDEIISHIRHHLHLSALDASQL